MQVSTSGVRTTNEDHFAQATLPTTSWFGCKPSDNFSQPFRPAAKHKSMDAQGYETRDSINNVWGARTPYKHEWPSRCDAHIIKPPEKWVQSACVLCRYVVAQDGCDRPYMVHPMTDQSFQQWMRNGYRRERWQSHWGAWSCFGPRE